MSIFEVHKANCDITSAVAFAMFDMDKDGFVSLEELIDMLRNTVKAHQDPLHVKMIASSLLRVTPLSQPTPWLLLGIRI